MAETIPPARTEITADKIVNLFPRTTRPHAVRIATYAGLRRDGVDPYDAAFQVGLDTGSPTVNRYERWASEVLSALGLPPLPVKRPTPVPFTADPFYSARRGQ